MPEIVTNVDPWLQRVFGESALEISEDVLLDTLSSLGEDVLHEAVLPLHIDLVRNARLGSGGNAKLIPDEDQPTHRQIMLRVTKPGNWFVLSSEKDMNANLLHELQHAVDFLDPALLELHNAYYDRKYGVGRPLPIKIGRYALTTIMHTRCYINSPFEERAFEMVRQARKQKAVPEIIKIVKKQRL